MTKCRPRKAVRLGAPNTHARLTAYRATNRHTTHLLQDENTDHGAYVQRNNAWARAYAHRGGARCWANEARHSNHWCVPRRWKAPATHMRPSLHIPARPKSLPRQNKMSDAAATCSRTTRAYTPTHALHAALPKCCHGRRRCHKRKPPSLSIVARRSLLVGHR